MKLTPPLPLNLPTAAADIYARGLVDALATFPIPAAPTVLTPTATVCVSLAGDDTTGDGSVAKPFATMARAAKVADANYTANASCLTAIALQYSPTPYTEMVSATRAHNRLYTTYGGVSPRDFATICPNTTNPVGAIFSFINTSDSIHFRNLRITSPAGKPIAYAISCRDTGHISVGNCEVTNVQIFLDIENCGAVENRGNFVANVWNPTGQFKANGVYRSNTPVYDSQGNVYFRCGWNPAFFDATNPAHIAGLALSHAEYEQAGDSANAAMLGNYYLDSAATGPMLRSGGKLLWSILQSNGAATDAVLGGPTVEMGDCVVLGSTENKPPYWGGGIFVQASAANVHDVLVLSASTSEIAPLLTVTWGEISIYGPMPANVSASVTNVRGRWAKSQPVLLNGRTATLTGYNVTAPLATDNYPTLAKYLSALTGTTIVTDDDCAECLRRNMGSPLFSAPAAAQWMFESWPLALPIPTAPSVTPPPVVIPPVPIPLFTAPMVIAGQKLTLSITPAIG